MQKTCTHIAGGKKILINTHIHSDITQRVVNIYYSNTTEDSMVAINNVHATHCLNSIQLQLKGW